MLKTAEDPQLFTFPSRHSGAGQTTPDLQHPRVLIVGEDAPMIHAMKQSIAAECSHVQTEGNAALACQRMAHQGWDILLLDMSAGGSSAVEVLRFARGQDSAAMCILTAARSDLDQLAPAIELGIHGLLIKPFDAGCLRRTIRKTFASARRSAHAAMQLMRASADIEILRQERGAMSESLEKLQQSVMEALLAALAVRESGAVLHAFRVQAYVSYFARFAGYPEVLRPHLERAALLHDIGKIGLSDNLLFRPGILTQAELDRMRPHTILGEQILARIDFLRPAAQIVRHHHEWFDGTGHPDGLTGERIPLGARLFAIIDALDAFTTARPYRAAQSFELAQREIVRCAGTHFDPQLTNRFRQIPAAAWSDLRRKIEVQHRERGLHSINAALNGR